MTSFSNHLGHLPDFTSVRTWITNRYRSGHAMKVNADTWQGIDIANRPDMVTYELMNLSFTANMFSDGSLPRYRADIQPNLPWADDHFEERVCGYPINPGVEWENWPWGKSADGHRDENGMFNHNYMERYWPKYAGYAENPTKTAEDWGFLQNSYFGDKKLEPVMRHGIRAPYGDLNDLVDLLARDPKTRQAYLPIYFPEDTGLDGRKPCTLGYQFIIRGNELHVYYPMRSCDFIRHFNDDCYLTVRLVLWVLDQLGDRNPELRSLRPGTFTMHATSLHVFVNDMIKMGAQGCL